MRAFEVRCWIPRAVVNALGPVRVETADGNADVSLAPETFVFGAASLPGSRVTVAFDETDDTKLDDRIINTARVLALTAINRTVLLAIYASKHHVTTPALDERDLHGFAVVEVASPERTLGLPGDVPRTAIIPGAALTHAVQRCMNPSPLLRDAEVRWLDALDAACGARTREAVVAARAAVEIAWDSTVRAAIADHLAKSPSVVHAVVQGYLDEATKGRTPIHERLGHFSLAILGVNFQAQAGAKWKDYKDAFDTRNQGAHGKAAIPVARSFEIVRLMRDLIDAIAVERAKYP